MSDLQKEFAALNDKIKACTGCPLCEQRIQAVPGAGAAPDKVEIMFIGEGPGANEDKTGVPFCGAAGKFLDEMLADIGLSRDQNIYITNIVKCRPPGNRDPEPDEKSTCSKLFLEKQIELLQPKIIVCLGRHAMNFFLPNFKISEAHGQFYRRRNQDCVLLPLYHPAAALYNGSMREVLKQDFRKIKKYLATCDEQPAPPEKPIPLFD